jgi:hypothetical protein
MKIDSLDLVVFFRQNRVFMSEGDCYMLIQAYDSNGDGELNLSDLMVILCPRAYTNSKNLRASQRNVNYALAVEGLNYSLEHAVVMILKM